METKPGIYTTEFWLLFLIQVLLTLNTLDIWNYLPERYSWASAVAQAILAGLYAVGRGIAKQGAGPDPNVPGNAKFLPTGKDLYPRR